MLSLEKKAREVRDTSLRVPHGGGGIILDVKVFNREDGDELPPGVNQLVRAYIVQNVKFLKVTRWPDVTVTKVLFLVFYQKKICLTYQTVRQSILC